MGQDSTRNQYLVAIWINLLSVSYGAACAWTSPSLPVLTSKDSPLESGPLTTTEASWIGGFLCVGGLCGTLVFGWAADTLGRKMTLLLIAFPAMVSWLLIIVAKDSSYFLASRFLSGFGGGGGFMVLPIFINEISVDHVRGSLGSLLVFTCNFGICFQYIAGYFVDYETSAWIFLPVPVLFFLGFLFFPETPVYLIKKNKYTEAERSLRYYRGMNQYVGDSTAEIKVELEKLQGSTSDLKKADQSDTKITMKDFTSKATKKALGIGIALMALNQFCGCFAMLNYTGTIFAESGSNLSPNMSAIIVGAIQIFGSYFSTALVERAGRKFLICGSAIGTGLGLTILGAFMQLKFLEYDVSAFQWIPLSMFSFVIFIANWGVLTLPFLVLSEIVPQKIKTAATTLCMICLWCFAFLAIKYFSTLFEVLGMHGTMFLFASCCFAGAIFVFICVPETKGKSFEQIAQILEK